MAKRIKHTPGPWTFNPKSVVTKVFPADHGIGYASSEPICTLNSNDKANARLISAAPDLLEALVEMMEMHAKTMEAVDWGKSFFSAEIIRGLNEVPLKARAAIAKATA